MNSDQHMDYNDLLEVAGDDAFTRHQRVQCQDHSKVISFTATTALFSQVLWATSGTPDVRPQGPSSSAGLVLFLAVSL